MEVNSKFFNAFLFKETSTEFFEAISNEAMRYCFHGDTHYNDYCLFRECYCMGGEL